MRSLLLMFLAACSSSAGAPTGATCAQRAGAPLTYDSFGRAFMTTYCTDCHSSERKGGSRHDAPADDNFDTLEGVIAGATEIDGIAGAGPKASNAAMPPEECTTCKRPSVEERMMLAAWIACEHDAHP